MAVVQALGVYAPLVLACCLLRMPMPPLMPLFWSGASNIVEKASHALTHDKIANQVYGSEMRNTEAQRADLHDKLMSAALDIRHMVSPDDAFLLRHTSWNAGWNGRQRRTEHNSDNLVIGQTDKKYLVIDVPVDYRKGFKRLGSVAILHLLRSPKEYGTLLKTPAYTEEFDVQTLVLDTDPASLTARHEVKIPFLSCYEHIDGICQYFLNLDGQSRNRGNGQPELLTDLDWSVADVDTLARFDNAMEGVQRRD
jgi:hypothetical protein